MRKRKSQNVAGMTALAFAGMTFLLVSPLVHGADDAVEQGKQAYGAYCARCHGSDAKGNGPDAKRLWIAPRDLTSGKFKFKSTVQGTPPSDEDLIDGIIGHGMSGGGMPSFASLEKDVMTGLVAYIKTISPAFPNAPKPEPLARPANEHAKVDIQKGKEVYTKLQCALCHGAGGHANGTSAFTLVDAWGKPIKAANLTQGWTYRAGNKPMDIYNRILAGVDGAPMPSYEGAASHEDIWLLSHYVASLQLDANWSGEIDAAKVNGALPTQADDGAWKIAKRTDINMQEYFYEGGRSQRLTVNAVSVQALYNDHAVAFRIFWEDPVKNDQGLVDALLVALKPKDYSGDVQGNLHTLYESDSEALDLMLWQAANADKVGQKKSNVAAATRADWTPAKTLESKATYDDGRWTLVFSRPLDLDSSDVIVPGSQARLIGFAAWDGSNGETGKKRTSSQWIRLTLGQAEHHD